MSSTPFSVSSWKRASGPRTAVQACPSQCSARAPVPEFRIEQQSDPTAHASAGELALTPFSRLSPLNALGLGTTENVAPAVPGTPSAAIAATSAARVSSRDDISPPVRRSTGCYGYTQLWPPRFEGPLHPRERQPAVDHERLPGHVAGLVGEQEHRHVRDLPGGSLTPERDRRALAARPHLRREPPERGVDQPRREQVRAHAAARALEGDVAGPPGEGGPRRGVWGGGAPPAAAGHRSGGDPAAAPA